MEEKLPSYSPDQIEVLLTDMSTVLSASVDAVTEDGTVEQRLAFRTLLYHSMVLFDSKNPGLTDIKEQG